MSEDVQQSERIMPWDRQPGEPMVWYARFRRWMDLPQRSLKAAYQRDCDRHRFRAQAILPRDWEKAHRIWRWEDRADAYEIKCVEEDAASRRRRMRELQEKAYQIGLKLLEKGENMAAFPLVQTKTLKDGRTVIIMPAEWVQTDATKMAESGVKMAREALTAPEEEIQKKQKGKTPTTPVEQMELLQELADGPTNAPSTTDLPKGAVLSDS